MEDKKYYSLEEATDRLIGVKGTTKRDEFDAKLDADLKAYYLGEAIRKARLEKNLTQTQLGELMGVKKSQISKIENGHNLTFATLARAFKAMGIAATLNFGSSQLSLW